MNYHRQSSAVIGFDGFIAIWWFAGSFRENSAAKLCNRESAADYRQQNGTKFTVSHQLFIVLRINSENLLFLSSQPAVWSCFTWLNFLPHHVTTNGDESSPTWSLHIPRPDSKWLHDCFRKISTWAGRGKSTAALGLFYFFFLHFWNLSIAEERGGKREWKKLPDDASGLLLASL